MITKLDKFGTFPHPKGPISKLTPPILFLVPSPSTYQDQYNTYLHFFNFSGGCTGHYLEKGRAANCFVQDETYGNNISDMNMIAGDMDLLVRSQLPKNTPPKCIVELSVRAEKSINEWLPTEVGKEKYRAVHIEKCQLEKINNPLKIEFVYYDWGISWKEKSNGKYSYYFTNIDLGEEINRKWFLGEESKNAIKKALLKDEGFMKTQFHKMVSDGILHPVYISSQFHKSLLVHNWIRFRDSTIEDLITALAAPRDRRMDRRISEVRNLLFRVMEIEGGDAFVSFFAPDLDSLYKILDVTHDIYEFHRIRTRIVTHSILLRPPFLQEAE